MSSDDDDSSSRPTVDDSPRASDRRIVKRETAGERYVVGAEIARGGMGRVVEATDRHLGRVVALKEALGTDPEMLRRFARETRITARLEHPSIVPLYDAGTADGAPYYVMRKVSGRPLEDLVDATPTLDARLALVPHVLAAANAIGHAHGRGIIHRDLKPSNILVGDLGETVVIDWGLAKVVDEHDDDGPVPTTVTDDVHTRFGAVVGTPGFMAAEQLRGDPADRRADVYALGATLYYLLARRPPHHAASGDAMMAAAAKGPPASIATLVEGVPPELATIVDKALAFDAGARYADAAAFAADLGQFLTGKLVASHHYSAGERLRRFVRRHRVAVATVAIAILALAIGGAFAVRSVLAERDRADDEARLATQRQREAEAAETRVRDRNDQLILSQARALLGSNPTAAVATLKHLATDRTRWELNWRSARAIAAEARRAGVARELPGPLQLGAIAIAPNSTRVVLAGDNQIRAYDLATGTHRVLAPAGRGVHVAFLDNDRVLTSFGTEVRILDWSTGSRLSQLELPTPGNWVVSTSTRMWWSDADKQLWTMPITGGAASKVLDEKIESFVVSRDGTLAFATLTRFGIVENDRIREIGKGRAAALRWSEEGSILVAMFMTHIERIELPALTRTTIDTHGMVADLVADRSSITYLMGGIPHVVRGTTSTPWYTRAVDGGRGLQRLSQNRLVTGIENRLMILVEGQALEILVPNDAARIVTNANGPYVLCPIQGHLLYWNIDDIAPTSKPIIDGIASYTSVGSDDFFVSRDLEWSWIDRTGTRDPNAILFHGPPDLIPSPTQRRIAFVTEKNTLAITEPGRGVTELEHDIQLANFLPDGRILSVARQTVTLHGPDGTKPTPLHTYRGKVRAIGNTGKWVAALYDDGHAWRRDLISGREETTSTTVMKLSYRLPVRDDGTVFFPDGERLVRWSPDGSRSRHVTFPSSITSLEPTTTRILVGMPDGAKFIVDPDVPERKLAAISGGTRRSRVYQGPSTIATVEYDTGPQLLDLEAALQWPLFHRGFRRRIAQPTMSNDGRFIRGLDMGNLVEWPIDLPISADATRLWLDQLTNAVVEGPTTMTWQHATTR